MTLSIEDYRPEHAASLVSMWRRSFEHGVGIVDPHPIEDQRAFFETKVVPESRVRVALLDEELVAFLSTTPERVEHLYVAVPHLGKGIGSKLLDLAKSESSGKLTLFALARNARACVFYERKGFVEARRSFDNMWNLEDVEYVWLRA